MQAAIKQFGSVTLYCTRLDKPTRPKNSSNCGRSLTPTRASRHTLARYTCSVRAIGSETPHVRKLMPRPVRGHSDGRILHQLSDCGPANPSEQLD
jgi:hypothetical protein